MGASKQGGQGEMNAFISWLLFVCEGVHSVRCLCWGQGYFRFLTFHFAWVRDSFLVCYCTIYFRLMAHELWSSGSVLSLCFQFNLECKGFVCVCACVCYYVTFSTWFMNLNSSSHAYMADAFSCWAIFPVLFWSYFTECELLLIGKKENKVL